MRNLILDTLVANMLLAVAVLALASPSNAEYVITEIIDATGDGGGNALDEPWAGAVDSSGNVYVTGWGSHNAFRITPGGTITEIIDLTGDGLGNALEGTYGVAVDSSGNVYVTGYYSDNAFKIATPGTCSTAGTPCTITEIIDATGDGAGNTLDKPYGVAADSSGNVYVTGADSDNAFKITPGGTITEIIDLTGDGGGNALEGTYGVAADSSGNVYVTGTHSDNAFKITTPGTCSTTGTPCAITEIVDATSDGWNGLFGPSGVAVDSSGNVYVAGITSDNAFKIATPGTCSTTGTPCTITEIIDSTGDGGGNALNGAFEAAVDSRGNVYVGGQGSSNAFKIATPGTCDTTFGTPCAIAEIIDSTGDGGGNPLLDAIGVAVDASGNVYVTGANSDNAFKIQPCRPLPVLSSPGLAVLGASLLGIVLWVARRQRVAKACAP